MSRLRTSMALASVVVAAVACFEGVRYAAYKDPVGIPTICFGETRGVKIGDRATPAQCEKMLAASLLEHEAGMSACLKFPDSIPDKTWAAMVSFTYNVGVAAFCKSTLARHLNSGSIAAACNQLLRWDKAGGFTLPGLTKRRRAERVLCLEGLEQGK